MVSTIWEGLQKKLAKRLVHCILDLEIYYPLHKVCNADSIAYVTYLSIGWVSLALLSFFTLAFCSFCFLSALICARSAAVSIIVLNTWPSWSSLIRLSTASSFTAPSHTKSFQECVASTTMDVTFSCIIVATDHYSNKPYAFWLIYTNNI